MAININLSSELEAKLHEICKLTQTSESLCIEEAIIEYLQDLEDGYIASQRMNNPNKKFYSTDEVLKELDK
jgi:RHH-type rel operon transcriptional repressor/antitoxin RelB